VKRALFGAPILAVKPNNPLSGSWRQLSLIYARSGVSTLFLASANRRRWIDIVFAIKVDAATSGKSRAKMPAVLPSPAARQVYAG
jgi:hypothetical protein